MMMIDPKEEEEEEKKRSTAGTKMFYRATLNILSTVNTLSFRSDHLDE